MVKQSNVLFLSTCHMWCTFLIVSTLLWMWDLVMSDFSLVLLMLSIAKYDLWALLASWCVSRKHGLSRSFKLIASLSLRCLLWPWSKDCDILIVINHLCFYQGSIVEWFYSCLEVYGIVHIEGIVVASISWVVVRTYISKGWLCPDCWCI